MELQKVPTGITGLDKILHGGLPQGRPTLLCGGPGCGKTALAVEFVCRGALHYGKPGAFLSFEESSEDIRTNFSTSGFELNRAVEAGKVLLESVLLDKSEHLEEAGEFTLDGLLIRLGHSLQTMGADRLVLDSLDALLSRFSDSANLRYELTRVFQWIKNQGITAILTCEREDALRPRYRLEEYVSDCVIHMDHRITDQISKRRLRVVKYRGSSHGTDEYPFLISRNGIYLLPITSTGLESTASSEYVPTGITGLDDMLEGRGYYRGSTVLISGGAGTGKSTVAVRCAQSSARKGLRSLYLAFEESAGQIVRNMRSVGIDLDSEIRQDLIRIEPLRPSTFGLEEHLVRMHSMIDEYQPETVVLDPISSFSPIGDKIQIRAMFIRLLDYLKRKGINVILISLTSGIGSDEETETEISSIVDTWIIIRFQRIHGRRQRQLYIHKARGMNHSQDMGELVFSDSGPVVRPFSRSSI